MSDVCDCQNVFPQMQDGDKQTVEGVDWECIDENGLRWSAFVNGWVIKLSPGWVGSEIYNPVVWNWRIFSVDAEHEFELYGGMCDRDASMRAAVRFVREYGPLMCFGEVKPCEHRRQG